VPNKKEPFSRILLPVDDPGAFLRAVPLARLVIKTMAVGADRIDLLHVASGTFMRDYMETIDVAAGQMPVHADLKRLHREYLEDTVAPLLTESSLQLTRATGEAAPGQLVRDGDPVKVICQVCREGNYSTVVMSRRKLTDPSVRLTSSVAAGLLHRDAETTICLAGEQLPPAGLSLMARCLIGVDDSPASRNAVIEAGMLLSRCNDEVEKVHLVHVLDQSCYYDEDGVTCIQASLAGQQALESACSVLIAAGVDQKKITPVIHFGRPGTVLVEEIGVSDATIIFIGRRDRSRMAQLFLGSVCTDIVINCRDRALVLVS